MLIIVNMKIRILKIKLINNNNHYMNNIISNNNILNLSIIKYKEMRKYNQE